MSPLHVVIFPFMSKGHTIPLLHLTRLLIRRGISITIFTTPANSSFIRHSLAGYANSVVIIELPFSDVDGIPAGIESTDQFPSMKLFIPFVQATKQLQQPFELALHSLLQPEPTSTTTTTTTVSCIISDGFLAWTQQSAVKFNIPRLVFYGTCAFSMAVPRAAATEIPRDSVSSNTEPFSVPSFPSLQVTKSELGSVFNDQEPDGPFHKFFMEVLKSTSESWGMLVNSFYELESAYVDYWNQQAVEPKEWCVGPLCLAVETAPRNSSNSFSTWLDERLKKGRSVIYVAFGSQAELSETQLCEIAYGLDQSEQDFLWVVRNKEWSLPDGFEERVGERGLVVRDWVEQQEILRHESVRGFLSHCGWNSVLESICEGVPILAWPMKAEQHLNAKLVVEVLGVGLRIAAGSGAIDGCVGRDIIEKMVRELMVGEKGMKTAKKMGDVGLSSRCAVDEGGSSWQTLNQLFAELGAQKPAVAGGNVKTLQSLPCSVALPILQ